MRCGMFTNKQGELLVIHNKELGHDIQWVEFEPDTRTCVFVYDDGAYQPLGIELTENMAEHIMVSRTLHTCHILDGKKLAQQSASVIIKDY